MKVTREEAMDALRAINTMLEHLNYTGAMLDDEFSEMDDAMEKICLYICYSKESK